MDDGDRYAVTVVTSSKERAGAPFREQLTARTVTLAASGTLFVDGRTDGKVRARTFQPDSSITSSSGPVVAHGLSTKRMRLAPARLR